MFYTLGPHRFTLSSSSFRTTLVYTRACALAPLNLLHLDTLDFSLLTIFRTRCEATLGAMNGMERESEAPGR